MDVEESSATSSVRDLTDVTDGCRGKKEEGKLLVGAGFSRNIFCYEKTQKPALLANLVQIHFSKHHLVSKEFVRTWEASNFPIPDSPFRFA